MVWLKKKVELFEAGHSWEYLDNLSIDVIGKVISVQNEIAKAKNKLAKEEAKLRR